MFMSAATTPTPTIRPDPNPAGVDKGSRVGRLLRGAAEVGAEAPAGDEGAQAGEGGEGQPPAGGPRQVVAPGAGRLVAEGSQEAIGAVAAELPLDLPGQRTSENGFDGHHPVQFGLPRLEDNAHASPPNFFQQLISLQAANARSAQCFRSRHYCIP